MHTICLLGPLQVELPSPSSMSVQDLPRILVGNVSGDKDGIMKFIGLDPTTTTPCPGVDEIASAIENMNKHYVNESEMDATARVLVVLTEILRDMPPSVKVKLQPSVANHSVFTEFLIIANEVTQRPLFLIEVKNSSLTTELTGSSPSVAQVLREVHLLMTEVHLDLKVLPFLLTNSLNWSFGLATKVGTKISVTSTFTVNLVDALSPRIKSYMALFHVLQRLILSSNTDS